jgi:uncharacterized protein YbjQ (UPF0145 family)
MHKNPCILHIHAEAVKRNFLESCHDSSPDRPSERIARLDANFEKTHFATAFHNTAIEELKKQARAAGADAIMRTGLDPEELAKQGDLF